MITNNLTLNDLYDIIVPEPASWWPPAPGFWILLLAFITVFAVLLIRWLKKNRKNAYRRAAMRELEQANTAPEIAAILRRTALVAYSRETVASLHGADWFQWLEKTAGIQMPESAIIAMNKIYSNNPSAPEALRSYTSEWIRKHLEMENEPC